VFLRKLPARLEEIAREKGVDLSAIEIWFADEARIGQKNKITRRWAKGSEALALSLGLRDGETGDGSIACCAVRVLTHAKRG
jgi:hypothetical protein